MEIQARSFVTMEYTLYGQDNAILDQALEDEPIEFVSGEGHILPGLDEALIGMTAGMRKEVVLKPEDAYGEYSDEMKDTLPRDAFPPELPLEVGMRFRAPGPHGGRTFAILEVGENSVVADFNHPLAGQTLRFDVLIKDVRALSEEELKALEEGPGCDDSSCGSCGCGCG